MPKQMTRAEREASLLIEMALSGLSEQAVNCRKVSIGLVEESQRSLFSADKLSLLEAAKRWRAMAETAETFVNNAKGG
jgi:hypothetical protein